MSLAKSLVFAVLALSAGGLPRTDGIRILAVESIAGKSHWNFMRAVLRALTDNGHTVTAFTPFPDGDRENYTEVDLSGVFPMKLDMDVKDILEQFADVTSILPLSVAVSRMLCDSIYGHERMREILRGGDADRGRYDVVIIEPLGSECVAYAATKLGLPMIYAIPSPMITHHERAFLGHVPNPAVVSHFYADCAFPATFVQRFTNAVLSAYAMFTVMYNERLLVNSEPKPYDLVQPVRPSAVFVNSHFITEMPRPLPPNVFEIGGVHLERPKRIPNVRNALILYTDTVSTWYKWSNGNFLK